MRDVALLEGRTDVESACVHAARIRGPSCPIRIAASF
jgi:hypothetical protein